MEPKPIQFSADSAADLPQALANRLAAQTIPLYVQMKGQSFRDGIDISPAEIFHAYETEGMIPTTSATPVGEYEAHFQRLLGGGACDVLHFCISAGISSCYQNARAAAAGLAGVFVVNSESTSGGTALLMMHAEELRRTGLSAAEIAADCEDWKKHVYTSVLLDSLTYMRKSGRCSALSALGSNVLGIRPVLHMVDGAIVVHKKLRGKPESVWKQYLGNLLARPEEIDPMAAFLYHTGVDDFAAMEDYVRRLGLFQELTTGLAGSVTCVHLGAQCMTLLLCKKGKKPQQNPGP